MKDATNPPITQTLRLEYCWVCFSDFKKNNLNIEHHHVVPRSYGGEQGPTVSLCCDCHTSAHKAADSLYSSGNPVVPYKVVVSRERCLYLAQVICNSRNAMENLNSENKRVVYSGFWDGKTHAKIKRLAEYHKLTQPKLLKLAIEQLYKRTFNEP